MLFNILRYIKRRILTKGFSKPVYVFLKELKRSNSNHIGYFINLSFDLELAYNTAFLERDNQEGVKYGQLARNNFEQISEYLNKNNIEYNVQIVGKLLEQNNKELFHLSEKQIELFRNKNVEIGLHGFSHQLFTDLSKEEADLEVTNGIRLFKKEFNQGPRFMSFPKNKVAHLNVLQKHQIKSWRSDRQGVEIQGEIPLGLWFAPGNLSPRDLKRMLSIIKSKQDSFLLHLWGHFTEMDVDVFKNYINVIKDSGWKFTNLKNYHG